MREIGPELAKAGHVKASPCRNMGKGRPPNSATFASTRLSASSRDLQGKDN